MYVYIRTSIYTVNGVHLFKLGITTKLKERESTYVTGEYNREIFIDVYEILSSNKSILKKIDKTLKILLKEYHRQSTGGTEFYDPIIRAKVESLLNEYKYKNYDYRKLPEDEIKHIERCNRIQSIIDNLDFMKRYSLCKFVKYIKDKRKWQIRPYQIDIINYGLKVLQQYSKFYLELATGGGKSYVVYKLIEQLQPSLIICLSPEIQINNQNSNKKYIELLQNKYIPYNLSKDSNMKKYFQTCEQNNKKSLIVACYQSIHKIVKIIKRYMNVFIWFDEAHWSVKDWMNDTKISKQFLIKDTTHIKYRIFTSASPNKEHIQQYREIFGNFYTPITVKELIDLNWLCSITPYVFRIEKNNYSISKYLVDHFIKYECNYGFSFHHCRKNAYKLFYKHYKQYKKGKIVIKPFLLVGEEYKLEDYIILEYEFRDINEFEKNKNSIGYVVQKYKMGYDFKKLDYIIFCDPKISPEDIIQCIGRGLRSDGFGPNNTNLNKKLTLMLPVYYETNINNPYKRIVEVLRYLVYDIGFKYNQIQFNQNTNINNRNSGGSRGSVENEGDENIQAILLDLLKGAKYSMWKLKHFVKYLQKDNIHNRSTYNEYLINRPELNLPDQLFSAIPDFTWEQTYEISPFYSKEECKSMIKKLEDDYDFDDFDDIEIELNKIDKRIPDISFIRYYGEDLCN